MNEKMKIEPQKGEKDTTESAGGNQPISRKEAIKKAGKYAAFTVAAMLLILEPV